MCTKPFSQTKNKGKLFWVAQSSGPLLARMPLKSTRNPLKLPSNTLGGIQSGLKRDVKRKAEEVLKKEITKQAKKVVRQPKVKEAVQVATALFPKQVKKARDIFGV